MDKRNLIQFNHVRQTISLDFFASVIGWQKVLALTRSSEGSNLQECRSVKSQGQ